MVTDSMPPGQDPLFVQRLLDEQRESWNRGQRVLVEAIVASHPALAGDREGLLDLIWNEVDLRQLAGEEPKLEEYCRRFPHLSEEISRHFEVYEAAGQTTEPPAEATSSVAATLTWLPQDQSPRCSPVPGARRATRSWRNSARGRWGWSTRPGTGISSAWWP